MLTQCDTQHREIDDFEVEFTIQYVWHMIDEGKNLKEIQDVLLEALKRVVTPEYRQEVTRYSVASSVDGLKKLLNPAGHIPKSSAIIDYEKLPEIIAQRYAALDEDERSALKLLEEARGYPDTFEYYKAITLRSMAKDQGETVQLKDTETWLKGKQKEQQERAGSI